MCVYIYISIHSNGYTHSLMIHSVPDHRPLFSLLALILIFNHKHSCWESNVFACGKSTWCWGSFVIMFDYFQTLITIPISQEKKTLWTINNNTEF